MTDIFTRHTNSPQHSDFNHRLHRYEPDRRQQSRGAGGFIGYSSVKSVVKLRFLKSDSHGQKALRGDVGHPLARQCRHRAAPHRALPRARHHRLAARSFAPVESCRAEVEGVSGKTRLRLQSALPDCLRRRLLLARLTAPRHLAEKQRRLLAGRSAAARRWSHPTCGPERQRRVGASGCPKGERAHKRSRPTGPATGSSPAPSAPAAGAWFGFRTERVSADRTVPRTRPGSAAEG